MTKRIVVTGTDDYVTLSTIPAQLLPKLQSADNGKYGLTTMLELYEQNIIRNAYSQYGSTVAVSKVLGISQPTAARKIKKYVQKK